MKRILFGLLSAAFLLLTVKVATAQQKAVYDDSNIVKVNLSQAEIDRIIQKFSAKEAEFRQALPEYGFRREATIQTIGFGGQISGEYRRDSTFKLNGKGERFEYVTFAPAPTLKDITLTAEDLSDLNGVNLFALEPSKINLYNLTFVGKEKIDELNLYVFDVAPKVMPDAKKTKERFFLGRIWVDDQDLQIVKSKGKGVPETKDSKYPILETWRENVDQKYWFPSYAYANDNLYFEGSGQTTHLKMKVKISDYKRIGGELRILDDDAEVKPVSDDQIKPKPPTAKKPQ